MPEWAELRITSDFINAVSDKPFIKAEKSEVSKVDTDLEFLQSDKSFNISSDARGKELRLNIHRGDETRHLLMFMGMSGGFALVRPSYKNFEKILKHSHLRFYREDESVLCFHDIRRFGKWKWSSEWSSNRGYDPVVEFKDWIKDITTNQEKITGFISEELMNQRWFNGVGNYLRAEILWRANINPWYKFSELSNEELILLINNIYECMVTAYKNQRGKIKDWNHPNDISENKNTSMSNWMKAYGHKNSSIIIDKNGRKFWFDPKWNKHIPEKYLKKKHKLGVDFPF